MLNLSTWLQFIFFIFLACYAPLGVMLLIAKSKWFPFALRTPLFLVGLMVSRYLFKIIPAAQAVKDISGHVFLGSALIFLAWGITTKWKWFDRNDQAV